MKLVSLSDVKTKLGIEEKALEKAIENNIKNLPDGKHRFVIEEGKDKRIVVVDDEDIRFIVTNADKPHGFFGEKFDLDPNLFLEVVDNLESAGALDSGICKKIRQVGKVPSINVWFEPSKIMAGEEAELWVDIFPEAMIKKPNIDVAFDSDGALEIVEEPDMPSQLYPVLKAKRGASTLKFKVVTRKERYGSFLASILFTGTIEGRQFSQKVGGASLRVEPLKPNLEVELIQGKQISAHLGRKFEIKLIVQNTGLGISENTIITGLEKYEKQILAEDGKYVGSLKGNGKPVIHTLTLRPKKSGDHTLKGLKLAFQDVEGHAFEREIPDLIEVRVKTLQPELTVGFEELTHFIRPEQRFALKGKIINSGDGDAKNVSVSIPVPPELVKRGQSVFSPGTIARGKDCSFELVIEAPAQKELRIDPVKIDYEDEEGVEHSESLYGTLIKVDAGEKPTTEKVWPFVSGGPPIKGRYRIIQECPEGGFAKVYHARDPNFQRDVAIKALKTDFITDQKIVNRFLSEARIVKAKKLDSAFIVEIYDVDEVEFERNKYPFIVMEFMEGGTLQDRLKHASPLSLDDILEVLDDLKRALKDAHSKGVIHCDIKPSNVFLNSDENYWKLGDFGLSAVMQGKEAQSTGGTPFYMAPEVMRGESITEKSDIYSLGVLMTAMLTGDPRGNLSLVKDTFQGYDEARLNELINLVRKMKHREVTERCSLDEISSFLTRATSALWSRKR